MENINDDTRIGTIYKNFINLQDIIKFAETKNAAIIASSGAIIAIVSNRLSLDNSLQIIFFIGYIFVVIALTISFWSLLPITHTRKIKENRIDDKTKELDRNLFLFTDIASFKTYEDLEKAICEKYYCSQELTSIEKDILLQVYTNSNIALRKLKRFKLSLRFFLFGILLMVISGPFL